MGRDRSLLSPPRGGGLVQGLDGLVRRGPGIRSQAVAGLLGTLSGAPSARAVGVGLIAAGILERGWVAAAVRPAQRPVRAAPEDDVVGAVDQPIEGALGEDRVGEERIPVAGGAVGGGDDRAGAGAGADELVEVLGLGGGELAHAEVIEDEHVGLEVLAQPRLPAAVGAAASQVPKEHIEGFYAAKYAAARFSSFRVQITMKYAADTEPMITCPGGGTGYAPTTPDNCSQNYTGKKVLLSLIWGPETTGDRIEFSNFGPAIKLGDCQGANQILGALVLVGVKGFTPLPLNVVGYQVNYDEATTAKLAPADVQALRAGRAFTVKFGVTLHFTTPCCDGFDTPEGLQAVIGAIHAYTASLSIHFTPRS